MLFASALAVVAFALAANAQTFTNCNPLNSTCSADSALGMAWNQTFDAGSKFDSTIWNTTAGAQLIGMDSTGASFALAKSGDSATVNTNFYIFWGSVEVEMKAAQGQGIISSIVLQSDDLDEIDWEIMGGNGSNVETNYFGKGGKDTSVPSGLQMNALYHPCNPAPMDAFHAYNVTWSQDKLEYYLDGNLLRTVTYADAEKPGPWFPQTPMFLKLGIWAGGDPSEPAGTIEWAGGKTDYTKGPFYMTIKSVKVQDGTTNATSYVYGDKSGSFDSIKVVQTKDSTGKVTKSAAAAKIAAGPSPTIQQRWNKLPAWARIVIIAVPVAIAAVLAVVGCFCCMAQRKLGRRERAIEDAQWEKNNAEMQAYRRQMNMGRFGQGGGGYQRVEPAPPMGL